MANGLLFYALENMAYRDYWKVKYNSDEAIKIIKKLSRHFKINPRIYFNTNKIGYASCQGNYIRLPKNKIALAMIIHELGHILAYKKYGIKGKGHNKYLMKTNKIIFRYSIKFLPINILYKIQNIKLLEDKSKKILKESEVI